MTVARRLFFHVALAVGFVVVVASAVTYRLIYQTLKQRDLQSLQSTLEERVRREEVRVQQVQTNLKLIRAQYLQRLNSTANPETLQPWDHWYRRSADGSWRSIETWNGHATLWTHQDWPDTEARRRQILIAQDLCDELRPGWIQSFPSFYFNFPGWATLGFNPRWPNFALEMPADYRPSDSEKFRLSLPENPPAEGFYWTGIQLHENNPTVSVFLPIELNGEFIASIGHDLFMGGILEEASRGPIPGISQFIIRSDGRLIAHPTKRAEIFASQGTLRAQDGSDPVAASLYKIIHAHPERRLSGFDPVSKHFYRAARLEKPDWYFITVMSERRLQSEAIESARWILWSGLISLAVVLGFIAVLLSTRLARPLVALSQGSPLPEPKNSPPLINPPEDLTERLGEVCTQVQTWETELDQLKRNLEKRELRPSLLHDPAEDRQLGELKSNFVSLVSHEFRTPLGVIMSATNVLQRYFEQLPAEKRARQLDMIFRSTQNLAHLIEGVLTLERSEAGHMKFSPGPVNIESVVKEVCEQLGGTTNHICPIELRFEGDLSEAVSDEGLLRPILSNLLSNAVNYSEPGRPVELSAKRQERQLVLTIADHGIGIPLEDRARLFHSFNRGTNVGSRAGTGLGLVIVQHCVQLHGGQLELESAPGQGTCVRVQLPVFASTEAPTVLTKL